MVRVVGEDITTGIYSIKDALIMADEMGLDLVEISPVLTTGVEYLWGSRKDRNDVFHHNNRLQASLRVNF